MTLRRVLTPLLLVLTVWLGAAGTVLLGAGPASAHAHLESMTPADGATLATPPAVVRLTFDEPVTDGLSVVTVKSPSGADVTQGDPTEDGATVTQRLAADLPAGRYTVAWKAVSDDGHPVSGTSTFTASQAGGEAIPPSGTSSPSSPTTSSQTSAQASAPPSATPTASTSDGILGGSPTPTAAGGASDTTGSSGLLWLVALALVVFGLLGWIRAFRKQRQLKAARAASSSSAPEQSLDRPADPGPDGPRPGPPSPPAT